MKRYSKFIASAILGLFLVFSIVYIKSPQDQKDGLRYYINNIAGKRCITYKQSIFSRKLKDRIPDYIEKSGSSGIEKCANKKELRRKAARNELFRISGGKGYVVEDLTFSYPYLTKEGKALLSEIGKRFRKKISGTGLRGSDFKITSMTRTTEILKKLKTSNSNASGNSPHFHGNAFDISYVRFAARKWFVTDCDKYFLKEALAEVIFQLREEKKCWATYEINQGCFHVVAR
jgi:hypothetical protein